jgi:hypothetical protein
MSRPIVIPATIAIAIKDIVNSDISVGTVTVAVSLIVVVVVR